MYVWVRESFLVKSGFDLFRIAAQAGVVIVPSRQTLRGSSSFLVDWQSINVGPGVIASQNVDFVVVIIHSFGEFHKATADCKWKHPIHFKLP